MPKYLFIRKYLYYCGTWYYGGGMPPEGGCWPDNAGSPQTYLSFFYMCLTDVFLALGLCLQIGKNLYI